MYNGKNVIGIVTEFNPFHEGHKYLIDSIRLRYGDCYVVAAMSGDFVQRGEPAIYDKYERTWAALQGGVDMVVQIPEMFSTSSAEDFAAGGVATLRSLGFVDTLLFGSESGDLDHLMKVADLELDSGSKENAKLNAAIRDNVEAGMSYAKARAEAISLVLSGDDEKAFASMLESVSGAKTDSDAKIGNVSGEADGKGPKPGEPETGRWREAQVQPKHNDSIEDVSKGMTVKRETSQADIFSARLLPNDILGVEYIKAVKRQGQCFRIDCIRRNQKFESAHAIRDAIKKPQSEDINLSPSYVDVDMLSDMLSYRMLQIYYLDRMSPEQPSAFMDYLDVSREIADALKKQIHERMTFTERIEAVKSKNYTYTRISRALLHILLGIRKKDAQVLRGRFFGEADVMPYVRVLGVRKRARDMLGSVKTTVVTSASKYEKQLFSVRRKETIETPEELILSINASHAETLFNQDMYSADIYNKVYSPGDRDDGFVSCGNEFTQKFIIAD